MMQMSGQTAIVVWCQICCLRVAPTLRLYSSINPGILLISSPDSLSLTTYSKAPLEPFGLVDSPSLHPYTFVQLQLSPLEGRNSQVK